MVTVVIDDFLHCAWYDVVIVIEKIKT